jgi:hypothetical protein
MSIIDEKTRIIVEQFRAITQMRYAKTLFLVEAPQQQRLRDTTHPSHPYTTRNKAVEFKAAQHHITTLQRNEGRRMEGNW